MSAYLSDVFSTLKRTGTIRDSDILGQGTYVLADGSKSQSVRFRIRSLKVGDRVVENVAASVAPSGGLLLLGQSFLGRFRAWSIDNARHSLVLEPHGAPVASAGRNLPRDPDVPPPEAPKTGN
jgi:hypothetical protein